MLLHNNHCRGKTSFIDLKTIDGLVCETYQQVCNRLGLLEDDSEWIDALEEAKHTHMHCGLKCFIKFFYHNLPRRFWYPQKDVGP